MRKSMTIAAVCVAISLSSALAQRNEIVLTPRDAGKTITVVPGEPLLVRLPGWRGQGFWRLDNDLTPQLILSGRTMDSVQLPGAPETTIFSFAPHEPGTVTLKASYVRSGGDQSPTGKFETTITVEGPPPPPDAPPEAPPPSD